jgi:hypothetical protein
MGEVREGARLFPRSVVLTCRRIVGDSDVPLVSEGRGLSGRTEWGGSGLTTGFTVGPGSGVVVCMAYIRGSSDGGLMAPELAPSWLHAYKDG